MPCDGRSAGEVGRRHLWELGQVGPGREDERLAGEHEADEIAVVEAGEEIVQRGKRGAAEDVRLLPVLAVVHRHERDRTDARRNGLEEEGGGGVRQGFRLPWARQASPLQGLMAVRCRGETCLALAYLALAYAALAYP